jgi:hypothetical protein
MMDTSRLSEKKKPEKKPDNPILGYVILAFIAFGLISWATDSDRQSIDDWWRDTRDHELYCAELRDRAKQLTNEALDGSETALVKRQRNTKQLIRDCPQP